MEKTDKTSNNQEQSTTGVVNLERLDSGVAILRLGAPQEKFISLTEKRLRSLKTILETLRTTPPRGLVILATAPEMFCVGADINLISSIEDPIVGTNAAREGQQIFDLLESLPFPTVAAISGPCVGGACELVLACKHRIISDKKASVIGLPEIKLGIIPGFGGTQRLPRLVGLPKALDIILAGKTLYAKQALACGLVDEIVSYENLAKRAQEISLGKNLPKRNKPGLVDWFLTHTGIGRSLVVRQAKPKLLKQTKGFYPAPPAALDAAVYGLQHGLRAGLDNEARELGRMIVTPESKGLVHVYFLTEASKAIGKSARDKIEYVHACVVGAGVMGAGIAGTLAKNDCSVIIKDTNPSALDKAKVHIKNYIESLKYLNDSERSFILNRVETTTGSSGNMGNVNLVIEAIVEQMAVKKQVLSELAAQLADDAVIASNTSSLSISELAAGLRNPERVIGMHFFNPVEKMPLVEIIRGEKTSDKIICLIAAITTRLGKFPIVVNDVPGFLVNRVLVPYLNEAAFLLNDGCSVSVIDEVATRFGMPMGPIRLLDEVGLDVAVHVGETMVKGYGDRMRAPDFAAKLVAAGRLGRKNGKGFYVYPGGQKPEVERQLSELLGLKATSSVSSESVIADRLMLNLVNEAIKCLDEGVAGMPGADAAKQIDLGTVMGIGFPPFHGGLIAYAERRGLADIHRKLEEFEKSFGPRFKPAQGIELRLKKQLSLYEPVR